MSVSECVSQCVCVNVCVYVSVCVCVYTCGVCVCDTQTDRQRERHYGKGIRMCVAVLKSVYRLDS